MKGKLTKTKAIKAPKVVDHRGTIVTLSDQVTVALEKRLKKNSPHKSATTEQLMQYIAGSLNRPGFRLFDTEAKALFDVTDQFTGPGEKSIRYTESLSLETRGIKSIDIPELLNGGTEVKKGPNIKAGIHAQEEWGDFLFTTDIYVNDTEYWDAPIMWDDRITTYRRLFNGAISHKILESLKTEYADKVRAVIRPEKILASYPNIALSWEDGYITIPRSDYAEAWHFTTVSQKIPRYRIRREYLERLALAIHQLGPDAFTIYAGWQTANEGVPVPVAEVLPHLGATDVNGLAPSNRLKANLPAVVEVPHVLLQVPSGEIRAKVSGI